MTYNAEQWLGYVLHGRSKILLEPFSTTRQEKGRQSARSTRNATKVKTICGRVMARSATTMHLTACLICKGVKNWE